MGNGKWGMAAQLTDQSDQPDPTKRQSAPLPSIMHYEL